MVRPRYISFGRGCCRSNRLSLPPAPVVSFVWASNAPLTDRAVVTITGLDFRTTDLTVTAQFSEEFCSTATWASKTSVACLTSALTGASHYLSLTASGTVGTRTSAFTFDGFPDFQRCQK